MLQEQLDQLRVLLHVRPERERRRTLIPAEARRLIVSRIWRLAPWLSGFVGVFRQLHAAAFSAAAGVNLRLHHHPPAQLLGRLTGIVGVVDEFATVPDAWVRIIVPVLR